MDIPDEIIYNILSRLSAKSFMRFKCLSTYWKSQIDSYFKSRRKILVSDKSLYALDDENVYSTAKRPFPFGNIWEDTLVVGTLNGIVILAQLKKGDFQLILYNPLTRAAKKLPSPPQRCCTWGKYQCAYGFGYGHESTPDDSKIVIGYPEGCRGCCNGCRCCDVFSLKKGSWTTRKTAFLGVTFKGDVGVFLNGYLHWISWYWGFRLKIVVLNVEEMEVLRLDVPDGTDRELSRLGTLHGRLCMVNKCPSGRFDVWVMNMLWSKKYSFTLGIDLYYNLHTICILEDGRIVVMDSKSNHFIFYDPSNGSHNVFKCAKRIMPYATSVEYVESLARPSDICYF